MLERHHLRLSADDLWNDWIVSREVGDKGDILIAYTPMGLVRLEERKDIEAWFIRLGWTIQVYMAKTERRAIHFAVLSYLQDLRSAVKDFIDLAKVKVDDDDANEEMCDILDLLSPNEETEEEDYEYNE